jgi:RNA polymerase sigma-70 factor (ECF subfamily)
MPRTPDLETALFEQLRPRLTAISRRIVGSEAEAQDIVQDCYLKWHRAEQGTFATPAAWLTTVVQHQSIDRLRKRARDAVAELAAGELLAEAPPVPPDEVLSQFDDVGEALARLLACLSPSERLALVLHEVFECAHADIAAVLGLTPVNARQHLARARRRLRERAADVPAEEKLCRELVRQFQAAINGLDVPAMLMLLAPEQPVSVSAGACANDALYAFRLAA